ncbi:MAG: hypothetical protein NT069_01520, partial [Planctomycetota bacterium]|nr:hypothetical protein [Planctomycetota bacterium]
MASSQDAHSSAANPNFVDVDGADNTLGYSTLGTGYNGGTDDNFYQARLSPAIDAADAWSAPATDILGLSRVDDSGVPNTGSGDYRPTQLGSNGFAVGGTAQGWRSNNTYFNLSFPAGFVFPFYRQSYTSVTVSTEGLLYFSGTMNPGSGTNSTATLQANRIIAPLWDNLSTSGVGDDIFVDTSIAGRLTVRWNATNEANNSDVNFSVTLFDDGTVQFNYGAGNTGLSPTIGISRGDGQFYQLSPLDAQAALTNSNSVKFSLTPGVTFADIGAYEFRGNSNDAVPPQVVATMPAFIESNGTSGMVVSQISVAFSEEVNAIDANAPANYELRRAVNGIFGDGDDVVYSVTPSYAFNLANSTSITTLDVGNGGAPLPGDTYRLTVHGNAGSSIHDTAGNRLDGNRDGVVTGSLADEYVRTFVILPPGINVSTISGPTTEVGGTATFSMVLNSQPTSDVTIPLSSNDLTEGTLSPANLTFTPANWNVPQSVTVTGVNDAVDDGDVPFAIVIGSAQSADARYNGLRPSNVAVVNTDDDTAGVGVSTISRSTTEAGGTATFTVVLTSEPTANVAIALASSDLTEGVVNKANLVFTPSNWNIPQFVTVTGVDDAVDDGDVGYAIVTSAAVSADPIYSDLNPADVSVVTLDDDTSGFTVSPISRHTTESAGTATFTVVLNSEPTANVSISLATTDTTEGSINKSELIFTPANWNSPQQVTVFGVNDAVDDGDVAFTITLAPATSTDPCYNGIDPADVDVTNDDDDTAGITVSTISGNPTEAGGIATFSLVLTSEPTASVTIGIASNDLTEATVNKTTLTFTPTNWNIPQVLTVTGVDDLVDDGDVGFLILTNAAVSGDASYSGLNATDVSVTTIDDDTASVLVSAISGMTTEAGGTATFSLVLGSQPTAAVTIGLTSDDLTEGVLSVGSVTFTPANWNVAQLVTVSGVDDAVAD